MHLVLVLSLESRSVVYVKKINCYHVQEILRVGLAQLIGRISSKFAKFSRFLAYRFINFSQNLGQVSYKKNCVYRFSTPKILILKNACKPLKSR